MYPYSEISNILYITYKNFQLVIMFNIEQVPLAKKVSENVFSKMALRHTQCVQPACTHKKLWKLE